MNENNKQAPTLQVLDSGGRYQSSSFLQLDDAVARFGQVVPNSSVTTMENMNRLTPGQSQGQCWPPYSYPHDPNNRSISGYDHYRPYPGFTGQFPEPSDQYSGNHSGFPMRYQEASTKADHIMSGNHLLCLDDGLNYPIPEARAASLPPFSSITTQSLPPRPQSAVKEDLRGFDEGLGARLTGGNNTPSHSEFGEGLTARLIERGMGVHSREDNYTPPVQYRPWEAGNPPGPVRVSSRSQSETSQTPPSSVGGYPSEKREDDGDSRSPWYRAKSDSGSFSKETTTLVSLDKPSDPNSGAQKGTSLPSSVDSQSESSNTYSPLSSKTGHHYPSQHGREEQGGEAGRMPFPSNSFGYFPPNMPHPLLGSGGNPQWDYRNDMALKPVADGAGPIDPNSKYPLVPPPIRPGEMQNMQHHYLDDRQMRGGRQQHGGNNYCQNGNDSYNKYPPHTEGQSPGMPPNPPNAQNYSGSGGMHMKPDLEPGLKGGDKHGSHGPGIPPPVSLKPGEMGGRGTKNAASMGDETSEKKPKKQKRKRCGECLGCQRKDNCGDCAPCRNEKSHQICKMRRCEKLIERKVSGPLSSVEPIPNKLECPDSVREQGWW